MSWDELATGQGAQHSPQHSPAGPEPGAPGQHHHHQDQLLQSPAGQVWRVHAAAVGVQVGGGPTHQQPEGGGGVLLHPDRQQQSHSAGEKVSVKQRLRLGLRLQWWLVERRSLDGELEWDRDNELQQWDQSHKTSEEKEILPVRGEDPGGGSSWSWQERLGGEISYQTLHWRIWSSVWYKIQERSFSWR